MIFKPAGGQAVPGSGEAGHQCHQAGLAQVQQGEEKLIGQYFNGNILIVIWQYFIPSYFVHSKYDIHSMNIRKYSPLLKVHWIIWKQAFHFRFIIVVFKFRRQRCHNMEKPLTMKPRCRGFTTTREMA
jgi:hypothetical protein